MSLSFKAILAELSATSTYVEKKDKYYFGKTVNLILITHCTDNVTQNVRKNYLHFVMKKMQYLNMVYFIRITGNVYGIACNFSL